MKSLGTMIFAAAVALGTVTFASAQYPAPGSAVIITASDPTPDPGNTITLTIQVTSPAAMNIAPAEGRAILASMPGPSIGIAEQAAALQAPPYTCSTGVTGGAGASVNPSTVTTNANGVATVDLFTGTQAATLTVTVSCGGGVSGQAVIPVGAGGGGGGPLVPGDGTPTPVPGGGGGTPPVVPAPPSTGQGLSGNGAQSELFWGATGIAALLALGTGAVVIRRSRSAADSR